MRKLSPASVALLRRVGPFFAALLRLRPRSVAPSRFPLDQERASVAAPVKARSSTSPSPLTGERAGVRGETVWKHLALASIALLSLPAHGANPEPASAPITAVRPLGFSPFNSWTKPLNPTSFAPTALPQPKSADPTQLPPANPSYT